MHDDKHYGTPEMRRRLKSFYREWRIAAQCGLLHGKPPQFPRECIGMLCGAKTRKGGRCRNDGTIFSNGRCKFHGGMSTGPKSAAGKAKAARNGNRLKQTP